MTYCSLRPSRISIENPIQVALGRGSLFWLFILPHLDPGCMLPCEAWEERAASLMAPLDPYRI